MNKIFACLLVSIILISCKGKDEPVAEELPEVSTPVTVTTVSNEPMEESVVLNATSAFLQKWTVRANATGYLKTANVQLNKMVSRGQTLYTVKTKEAESIGNTINILDSSFGLPALMQSGQTAVGLFRKLINRPAITCRMAISWRL